MSRPYTSTAVIRLVPSQVPDRLIPAQIHADFRRDMQLALQPTTSRSSLNTFIQTFDLYPIERKVKPMQDIILELREHIKLRPVEDNAVSISFTYPDRFLAQRVVGHLVGLFITAGSLMKTQTAKLGLEFLKESARQAGNDWEEAAARLRERQKDGKPADRALLDADIARHRYLDLSTKVGEAEMMTQLQVRQQGETLELLDPASLPSERQLPWTAIAVATAGGGILGWVIAYLMERRRTRLALAEA